MTVLRNTRTGERKIVGQFVSRFARENGLCLNDTNGLVPGRLIMYKHWASDRPFQLANSVGDQRQRFEFEAARPISAEVLRSVRVHCRFS